MHILTVKEDDICSIYITIKTTGVLLKDGRAKNVPTYTLFLKLATRKGNHVLLPKRPKN